MFYKKYLIRNPKIKMKRKLSIIFLSICLLVFSAEVYAQKIEPPKPGAPGPPGTPIDGGLSLLIIAGVAYGVYEKRRKK